MSGVPNALYFRLRNHLLDCGPFNSNEQLRDIFANTLIIPWRNQLRDATSRDERVDALITLLMDRHRIDIQTNALVLFMGILRDRTDPATSCYHQLASVMKDLDSAFQVNSPSRPPRSLEEANPQNQRMMFTADLIRLVESIEAVGQVNLAKRGHGKVAKQFLR